MSNKTIKRLLVLGALAILGIIIIQSYYVINTWNLKDQAFDASVRIALRKTAEQLAEFNNSHLPKQNIIQRRSSNTYVVNFNDEIDAQILENYLIQNFEKRSLDSDFEYGIYDCQSDNMVYGEYCDIGSSNKEGTQKALLPKFKDLEYYFVIRFPNRAGYLVSNMRQTLLFSLIALLAISFFVYSIIVILKQRRLSEMQRDFINNMTHEFKTPIASIKLAANSISQDPYIQSNSRLSKYTQLVDEQGTRLNEQVEKLLNVAALEKQSLELQLENIHMNELLSEITEDLEIRLKDNKGKIDFIEKESSIYVKADRIHLTNVLYSLLDNAIKYSPDTPEIKIILDKNGFEIQDKGIGIESENLNKIFKKFYRVPTGNIHDVKGFGLGLFYVKTIINKLNWIISITSKLHEGTNIRINFT